MLYLDNKYVRQKITRLQTCVFVQDIEHEIIKMKCQTFSYMGVHGCVETSLTLYSFGSSLIHLNNSFCQEAHFFNKSILNQ